MTLQRLGRSWVARMSVSAALVGSVLGITAAPSSASTFTLPMAAVATGFQFLGVPSTLPAAHYDLQFFNISQQDDHEFVALNLGPVCSVTIQTVSDAKALLEQVGSSGGDPEVAFEAACPGGGFEGTVFAPPGGRDRGDFTLAPGRTLYFCGVPEEDGTPHFELGMIGFINVFALPLGF